MDSDLTCALEAGNPIVGVFAYLDATLEPDVVVEAASCPLDYDHSDYLPWRCPARVVVDSLRRNFRLQHWGCALTEELEKYRLYNRDDMAAALAGAYFRFKRGADPIEAFTADYSLGTRGILTWEDIGQLKEDAEKDHRAVWWHFNTFYKSGDRVVKYRTPSYRGYFLVRGDRLVWEYQAYHGDRFGGSPRFEADMNRFIELGGTKGFLRGDFDWPPPDWINPVTDEEESAASGKTLRGVVATSAEPSPGGVMQCSIDGHRGGG